MYEYQGRFARAIVDGFNRIVFFALALHVLAEPVKDL